MENNNNLTDLEYDGDIMDDKDNNNKCKYNSYPSIAANNTNGTKEDIWINIDVMDIYMVPYNDGIMIE